MSEFQIIALTPAIDAALNRVCAMACAAARAGAIGILDIERDIEDKSWSFELTATLPVLRNAGGTGATGIKCGINQISLVLDAISATPGGQLQYIVFSAGEHGMDKSAEHLAGVIASLKEFGLKVFVEVINIEQAVSAQTSGADAVIGKGSESPGLVGEETAFVLLQRLRKAIKLPIWVRGGVGTHTIAACAAGGAQGVVLDGQLLLARESPLSAKQRAQLTRMDGSGAESSIWGQSAAFASALAEKGRTVSGIITELRQSLSTHLELAAGQKILSAGAPLAQSHGTRFPVLQGAMTRVSDTAEFASCVAQGGALPFLALALMRGQQVYELLSECKSVLAEHPWGAGILGFVPEPLWHEQMEAVLKAKPPYALIAGGRPDQSKMLEQAGIKTYLHVPSPLLLNAFIDEGARRFIFEGRECGGHVGPRSSFVLWQLMIDVLLQRVTSKEDVAAYHVVFAGGIHDSVSAAMTAALAAPLAAAGMRVGVLVGTAYLFTQEAVESGAIVETFQRKAIECTTTALLETGPGHSIRVIDSPYRATFEAQRVQLQNQNKNWQEIREELELMNLGRLRVASKGLMRAAEIGVVAEQGAAAEKDAARYAELSAQVEPKKLSQVSSDQQWQDGMYMIGQVATLHDQILTIEQLHDDICEGGQRHLEKMLAQAAVQLQATAASLTPTTASPAPAANIPIAIVGMSCMLPQANDVEKFWRNILNRVDSIIEVPEKYWNWKKLYDPDPLAPDKIVSKWGGFLDAIEFDPTNYGIPPSSMSSVDPMQLLILEVARRALIDAGYEERDFPRSKTSVILANAGHGPVTALYSLRSMLDWKLSSLPSEQRKHLEEILPEWTEDSFPGTLGNVTAGRVSNRFDLGGLNFAVDAACASSLAALYVGVNDLRSGGSDVVLLAATDTHNQPGDYLSFSKTHALSPDGRCKTFDATANGIAISEGIAVLVLKRLADAETNGDTVYAVIKGVGGSSDGRALSLTAPRPAGQVLALQRAYKDAGVAPSSVSLIEAHGTGTVAGDRAEIEALNSMFSASGSAMQMCAVGSVKSNIGHTKCTAGLASIIKVAKALHHKVLPPTIGVKTPNAACNFGGGPFYINSENRPWFNSLDGQPRRAGVSAFGFGGTNFHAVLEEYLPKKYLPKEYANTNLPGASMCLPAELFVFRAASPSALKKQVAHFESEVRGQLNLAQGHIDDAALLGLLAFRTYLRDTERKLYRGFTFAVVASTVADLLKKLKTLSEMSDEQIERGLKDPQGIYLQDTGKPEANAGGLIAFLFPGQGSQRLNMLADMSMYFPQVRRVFERADRIYRTVTSSEGTSCTPQLSHYIFPPPSFTEQEALDCLQRLTDTSVAQAAIGVADLAMYRLLRDFEIEPDMFAGHSYGEYAALAAAGAVSEEQLVEISVFRGKLMNGCAKGSMVAVSANASDISAVLAELKVKDLTLANYNAPQQCVLSGSDDQIESVIKVLREKGYDARKLPVSAAFHNPAMQAVCDELAAALMRCNLSSPERPVYSNLTAQPHESDATAIAHNLIEHTVKPVQFMQEIEQMYADGARIFIEVGPGSVLTNLVENILTGKPHLAVATDRPGRNGVAHFQHVLAVLIANGRNLNLAPLFENRCLELEAVERLLKKAKESTGNKKSVKYLVNSYSIESISDGKLLPIGGQIDRLATGRHATDRHAAGPRAEMKSAMSLPGRIESAQGIQNGVQNIQDATQNILSAASKDNSSVESVMLQFQQTMAQMTNNFLQAQQSVMLAYLNNVSGSASGVVPGTPIPATAALNVEPDADQSPLTLSPTDTDNAAETLDAEDLISKLIDIVSERTGYPPEMLEPNLDLEADLGIDSIKRIEILSTFRKMLPPQVIAELEGSVEKLASTRTLAGIFDWVREAVSIPASQIGTQPALQMLEVQGQIGRGLVKVIDLPEVVADSAQLPQGTVFIYGGNAEIVALLQKRGLTNAVSVDGSVPTSGMLDSNTLSNDVPIAGLIYLGALTQHAYDTKATIKFAEMLKSFKNKLDSDMIKGNLFVLAATKLGGTFGFGDYPLEGNSYEQAAIAGLIKTLSREWIDVHSRVIDFEPSIEPEEIADRLIAEITDIATSIPADHYQVEVGYRHGQRHGLIVEPSPLDHASSTTKAGTPANIATPASPPSTSTQAISLDDKSVILLTGGARGITAQLALALAQHYQPRLILLGRHPLPEESELEEPDEFARLYSARELKAAIMEQMHQVGTAIVLAEVEARYKSILKERAIRQTLAAIKETGAQVEYRSLNVCDKTLFGELINDIYDKYGRLDGIIHGAGIIEDAYLTGKQIDSFRRVIDTKVLSAQVLADKVRFDQLQFMFFLSSVVSRTGNTGQADYVAANEVLNKLAVKLNRTHKTRVASLLWGPWNGGMARPELENLFARYGWTMITNEQGRDAFMRELVAGSKNDEEVLLVAQTAAAKLKSVAAAIPSAAIYDDGNDNKYVNGNGTGHSDGNGNGNGDNNGNGHDHESKLMIKARGARLFNSYALEKDGAATSIHFTLSTQEDLYLNDHCLNGLPVLPMAMATELLAEASFAFDDKLHPIVVRNLQIPSGIIFDEPSKNFVTRLEPSSQNRDVGVVKVCLSSVGSKECPAPSRDRFTCDIVLADVQKLFAADPPRLPMDMPVTYKEQKFIDAGTDLPVISEAYQKWFFHGPMFQGIQEVLAVGVDGIAGTVLGSSPAECLKTANDEHWIVDPVLLDSAMQLAGIWAWKYLDMMVLPTGFRSLSLFGAPSRQVHHVIVRIPQVMNTTLSDHSELLCDLAIYGPSGEMIMLLEGLSGIGSRSFNRLVAQPKELRK